MNALYFAFLAVLIAGIGARDQAMVAALSLRQGARPAALITAILVSAATAAGFAWAAMTITPMLSANARVFFAGLGLMLAGGELLLLFPRRAPAEPTLSLGALAIVLIAFQAVDAGRFLIFAIAVATAAPVAAGIGGALGGAAIVAIGWAAPAIFGDPRLRLVRRGLGAALALAGVFVALRAIGRV